MIGHRENGEELVVTNQQTNMITESFRSVRLKTQDLLAFKKGQVIGLTSTVSGEGKTFCALNLASSLALSGKKTIIIGGDLRKPKLGNTLNLESNVGLSEYLVGRETKILLYNKQE